MHYPSDTLLAPNFRASDYEQYRDSDPPNRVAIADAIQSRFIDRYLNPVKDTRSGFTMMAVSCLAIEALESFRQGWESSDGRSKAAFCYFFDASDDFHAFRGHAQAFYKHIRCGILHQAETTAGWRILRKGPLFDSAAQTINATRFLKAVERTLLGYCKTLKTSPWDSPEWKNARRKMDSIIHGCRIVPGP